MRDRWLTKMNGGMLPLDERGMLATLWDWGQPITASAEEMAEIMCTAQWYRTAQNLKYKGKIDMEEDGTWIRLTMLLPDEKRRKALREAQRRRRRGKRQ